MTDTRKYVVLVPDGCADWPVDELDGRTPLEAAVTPNIDALSARSEVGRAAVIPAGMPPGSDVGNMAILGYDPADFHTGRAPIEAAAMGVALAPDEVAFRCNLVTVHDDTMVDFAAGHLTTDQAAPIVAALSEAFADDDVAFHAGVEYRHLAVLPAAAGDAECVPPHDLTGKPVVMPSGPSATTLVDLMKRSRSVVEAAAAEVGSTANQIWLWGQGRSPVLDPFEERYGLTGGLTSAVDLVRGLGALTGLDVVDVPGATAGFDNDYAAQRDATLAGLEHHDFFLLHVEATDEAGHQGLVDEKVSALERWDADIVGPLCEALAERGPHRILMMPDHATPLATMTHSTDAVPYLRFDSENEVSGRPYTESAVADLRPVSGHGLLPGMLSRTD
ncbi:MAG: cofactor-independent phosphoglycerate mutase [Acidimicrobiia bacterium]